MVKYEKTLIGMAEICRDYLLKVVEIRFENMIIPCDVGDVRSSYGKIELFVKPVHGHGVQWVSINRIVK